jgi:hypothetical protein
MGIFSWMEGSTRDNLFSSARTKNKRNSECIDGQFFVDPKLEAKMKFKVGDRVAVYDGGFILNGNAGVITKIFSEGKTVVKLDVETEYAAMPTVHMKQCRRLIKKPRRRVWARFCNDGTLMSMSQVPGLDYVEFIEVRKKK